MDAFVVGTNGACFHKWQDGTDNALYQKTWNGSAWSPSLTGWRRLGGIVVPGSSRQPEQPEAAEEFAVDLTIARVL